MDPRLVRAELDRILRSPGFAHSERMARFLRCVVERAVAGRGEEVKEYLLGVEVFDRKSDYDPRVDPIVRVEARRLRAKLEEFYAEWERIADSYRTPEGILCSVLPISRKSGFGRARIARAHPKRRGAADSEQQQRQRARLSV